jgi:hypothetical protein
MTDKDIVKSGDSGHCVAYICDENDLEYTRVGYDIDFSGNNFVEETWPENKNPNAFDEDVILLVDPWVRKPTVIKCLEEIIEKIESEGLYLGSWAHPDQCVMVFDDGERIFGVSI